MTEVNLYKIKGVSGSESCPSLKDLINTLEIFYRRDPNAKVGINTFDCQLVVFAEDSDEFDNIIEIPEIN